MKRLLLAVFGLAAVTTLCYGQGQIAFANFGSGENWPMFMSDGTTKVTAPYVADLQWVLNPGATIPAASALVNLAGFNTVFKTGSGAGFFLGGAQTISATTQIAARAVVWNPTGNKTWADAAAGNAGDYGYSSIVLLTPTILPNTPALFGLGALPAGFKLNPVPEPSTLVLAGLGLAGLLAFRRRS